MDTTEFDFTRAPMCCLVGCHRKAGNRGYGFRGLCETCYKTRKINGLTLPPKKKPTVRKAPPYHFDKAAFEAFEGTNIATPVELGRSLCRFDPEIPCTHVKRIAAAYKFNGKTVYNTYNQLRLNGGEQYHGGPCGECGGTLRHPNGSCVECHKEQGRKLYEENPERDREKVRKWSKANPELCAANVAKRRAAKIERTAPWADDAAIKAVYAASPEGYHVDHMVPLQGKYVSGLHVEYNLQVLPASENCSKHNRFDRNRFSAWYLDELKALGH